MVVIVVGLAGTLLVWRADVRDAAERQDVMADMITETARSTASNVVAGLGGSAGLVDSEGEVDPDAFEAFRRDVASVSSLGGIAYVPVVEHDQRAAFEQSTGRPITDLVEAGFTVASERDRYWPVQTVSPSAELTEPLLGLDLARFPLADDVARAARDLGRERITEAVSLDDFTIFFIIRPLYLPDGELESVEDRREAHVGFVVSFYDGGSLGEGIRPDLPEDVRFTITDGETVLAASDPPAADGVLRELEVGGRTWTLHTEDDRPVDHSLAWLLMGITALIAAALTYVAVRSGRHERDMARAGALIGRTADLAQHLAGAADVEAVADVIAEHVPSIFGARAALLALVDVERGVVSSLPGTGPGHRPAGIELQIDDAGPLTDVARSGDLVLSTDRDWSPEVATAGFDLDVIAAYKGAAGLALEGASGETVATLAVVWTRRPRFDPSTLAAMRTVAELCEQTLQRAKFTDQVGRRAAQLADLAKALAGVSGLEAATAVLTDLGRAPVGSHTVAIGIADVDAGVLRVHYGAQVDDLRDVYGDPPLDQELAITDAARTGEPVFTTDFETYQDRYPDTDPAHAQAGTGARAALPLRDDGETIGAIAFTWPGPRQFDGPLVSTMFTIAEMAAQAVQRARLAEHLLDDARHSRDLAELAQGLAGLADTEDVTSFLASSIVTPLDAIHAAVGLVADGQLHRHLSEPLPGMGGDGTDMPASNPLDVRTPLTDAARTGEDVLIPNPAELEALYPRLVPVWAATGFRATANVALRDRTGRVIGALGVAWDHPVLFTKELRDRLSTVVGIASQTLERAQLVERVRVSADRKELLAELARHLSRGRTAQHLVATISTAAAAPVEASVANLALVDDPTGVHDGLGQRSSIDVLGAAGEGSPGVATLRTQQPVLLTSPDEIEARYPGAVAAAMAEAGVAASAHLPLRSADGEPLGTLAFGWDAPRQFDPGTLALMRTIAQLCTQTLERTRLGEAEHRLVLSLQHRVVTPLPAAPGLSIAQRYRPSASHVGMGGDWYEGIPLDDGRYALVVGDIAGHGITAVADMIQLRSIIESLIRAGVPIGEVFPRASDLLIANGHSVTASASLAVIDVATSSLSYVVAGHPPPVLRNGDGTVTLLEDGRQPLLGIPMAPVAPATVPFPAGSVVVGYTDGLIERRDEVIDASIHRLQQAVDAAAAADCETMADQVMASCLDGREPDDDVALVLIAHL